VVVCLLLASAVIGHICVLPDHAHALPTRYTDHDDHNHADDAVHEASCEAVGTSAPITILAPALADLGIAEQPALALFSATTTGSLRLPAVKTRRGPALFLLHASLLI
jgi:hypothetical protein